MPYPHNEEPPMRITTPARLLGLLLTALPTVPAAAASVQAVHRFVDTGNSTQSHYAIGASPYAELLQASDGNFYGTTFYGGSGLCPNRGTGGVLGCGTIFRMTPQHVVTTLYSFPYDTATSIAPNGAFPTAGLIQGKDGFLYGVAQDGGVASCNGSLGCGTLFRISTAGAFTLLHQFCSGDGCGNSTDGGRPMGHLVQLPNNALCGTTQQGGLGLGTLFCASTAGAVTTTYAFDGAQGEEPVAALLASADGKTLYGTTEFGGANGQGTVFSFTGRAITTLHAFGSNSGDMSGNPRSALIFGANGRLYGTTYSGSPGGSIFWLNTDGSGYASKTVLNPQVAGAGFEATSGLLLARNGVMYGTTYAGGTGDDGCVYSFNPVNSVFRVLASFGTTTGAAPVAALIEGSDNFLYGTASLYGGSNSRGSDAGSVVRVVPVLKE